MNIIALSGSLRKDSYNSALLRTAKALAPQGMNIEIVDIHEIPLYNGDFEQAHYPEAVRALREKIRTADGLIIATPEYNYSIPGVLKNTIDWLSRPSNDPVLSKKPLVIMGASMGMMGTSRAQYHLRQCCVFLNMYVLNTPELFIGAAHTKFDAQLQLTDAPTKEVLTKQLHAFQDWVKKLS